MKKNITLMLFLLLHLASIAIGSPVKTALPEHWVDMEPVELPGTIPEDKISNGVFYLLLDTQVRKHENIITRYTHVGAHIINPKGIDDMSQLTFDFNPSYETLILNNIKRHRNGKIEDLIPSSKISLLQREQQLENKIYDGSRTANVILNDIRVGDTLEYSYTIRGSNPVFNNMLLDSFKLGWSVPLSRQVIRILIPESEQLAYKLFNHNKKPTITNGNGFREYRLEIAEIEPTITDPGLPSWYNPYPGIQFSQAGSWKDVNAWSRKLYRMDGELSPGLMQKVGSLKDEAKTKEAFITGTLRFVQEEIRYLGIEMGAGSHKPSPPSVTFDRRFGDCKDKTMLFLAMLKQEGITAYPALVNTYRKHTVAQRLPSPLNFNHVIAVVILDGKFFWLDPTDTCQRGDLSRIVQANFGKALIIAPDTRDLTEIPSPESGKPSRELSINFDLSNPSGEEIPMVISTRLTGLDAEYARNDFLRNGLKAQEQRYRRYYANLYPAIATEEPMTLVDNARKNLVLVTEKYKIHNYWKEADDKKSKVGSVFPLDINAALEAPSEINRTMPYALSHPVHIKQETTVRIPRGWSISPDNMTINTGSFSFNYQVRRAGEKVFLNYTYKSLKDHVPPKEIARHIETIDRIKDTIDFSFQRWETDRGGIIAGRMDLPVTAFALLVLCALVFVAFKIYKLNPEYLSVNTRFLPTPALTGLGGWLIPVCLGMIIGAIKSASQVLEGLGLFTNQAWADLSAASHGLYNSWTKPLIIFEFTVSLYILVFMILALVLFFQKKRAFPKMFIILSTTTTLFLCVDYLLTGTLSTMASTPDPSEMSDMIKHGLSTIIWSCYMLSSERVSSTFRNE